VGLGWSILPRSMVDADVSVVDIEGLTLSRQLGVVTHRQRSLTNAAQAFLALLNNAAQEARS